MSNKQKTAEQDKAPRADLRDKGKDKRDAVRDKARGKRAALRGTATCLLAVASLALAGCAAATVFINCLNTQALYSVINTNAVTLDCPWEPTVTGRYELAVSSDGVRTTARQSWPTCCCWIPVAVSSDGYIFSFNLLNWSSGDGSSTALIRTVPAERRDVLTRYTFVSDNTQIVSITNQVSYWGIGTSPVLSIRAQEIAGGGTVPTFVTTYTPLSHFASLPCVLLTDESVGRSVSAGVLRLPAASSRSANELERAAYNAGGWPTAFKQ